MENKILDQEEYMINRKKINKLYNRTNVQVFPRLLVMPNTAKKIKSNTRIVYFTNTPSINLVLILFPKSFNFTQKVQTDALKFLPYIFPSPVNLSSLPCAFGPQCHSLVFLTYPNLPQLLNLISFI